MILGIDTSNYTTAVALLDKHGKLLFQRREKLEVELGKRGLRQSEAVFQHVNKLPDLITEAITNFEGQISKIVVSTKPRPRSNSYMPVFKVGAGQAKSLAAALDIPLLEVSHQEGHLMSGLWSANVELDNFLAVHLSGGTSEVLKVKRNKKNIGFDIEVLGESQDLHAGQFIDRVGVELGLPFPAGPKLEELATTGKLGEVTIPSSVKNYQMSFSGPCSAAMRLVKAGRNKANIALAVQQAIANTLEKVLRKAIRDYNCSKILIVGGVAANQYIRNRLSNRLEHQAIGARLYFADTQWSSDNAVGVAALGLIHK